MWKAKFVDCLTSCDLCAVERYPKDLPPQFYFNVLSNFNQFLEQSLSKQVYDIILVWVCRCLVRVSKLCRDWTKGDIFANLRPEWGSTFKQIRE